MATPTIADVLIDELALILERRDHPPRERQVPGQPPTPTDPAAAAANLDRNLARDDKVKKIREHVDAAADTDAQMMRARVAMLNEHVTGLSFSGGGIRGHIRGRFPAGAREPGIARPVRLPVHSLRRRIRRRVADRLAQARGGREERGATARLQPRPAGPGAAWGVSLGPRSAAGRR